MHSATELATDLAARSGLDRLRAVLLRQFTDRSRVLKAHSALTGLGAVLRTGGCRRSDALYSGIEQITSSAHEFAEVRLLDQLRTGVLELPEDQGAELDRLLGGSGHDPASRLGIPDDTGPAEIAAAAMELLGRWQLLAEHPLSSRPVQVAARGASRTLEGMLSQLSQSETGPVLRRDP